MSLELQGVSVLIGRRPVVQDVSLQAADAHVVGLLGPNGSGKSTVLKTLYRTRRPSSGRILLDGADLFGLAPRDAARRIAVVAQDGALEFDATVAEVVMVGRTPHQRGFRADSAEDRHAVEQALERVGCAELAERSIHTLSGGERQRVFIARALAQGGDHLVLDEPTNHLDIRYQIEVLEIVARLGVTVLAALHDLSLAALYCNTVHLMNGGRVVAAGAPADVITPDTVRETYGAEVLVIEHPETGTPQLIPRRHPH